ncbi:ChaC-like protein [Opisthorchis viverrini]|uniref:glutathione-specific gamma-glutamylcyclotransferase n=1 Tax=Opisthorchis viverrini TaxID=6198 RepID=A0A1S8WJ03_OPIVI|nr:ChaC-like protein [Opisthorchis viverrini]
MAALADNIDRLRVFGYGSLIWKPNFVYSKRSVGYIEGYVRRFFQGDIFQRGTLEKPGRVATLVSTKEANARVWGCVYEVVGAENIRLALDHLIEREVVNGGYCFDRTYFHPGLPDSRRTSISSSDSDYNIIPSNGNEAYEVLFHLSDPDVAIYTLDRVNEAHENKNQALYLGSMVAHIDKQADARRQQNGKQLRATQITSAFGVSGANSEYVLLIAAFMHYEVPKEQALKDDPYIFQLEAKVREKLALPPIHLKPSEARKTEDEFTASDLIQPDDLQINERRRSSAREFAECLLRRKKLFFHKVHRDLHAEFSLLFHQAPSNSQLPIHHTSYLTAAITSGRSESSTTIRTDLINAFGHPDKTFVTYESVDIRQEDFL